MDLPFSNSPTSFSTMSEKQHLDSRYCNSFRERCYLQRIHVLTYHWRLPDVAGIARTHYYSYWTKTFLRTWQNWNHGLIWTAGDREDFAFRSRTTWWNSISSCCTSLGEWYWSTPSVHQGLRSTWTMAVVPYYTHRLLHTCYPRVCMLLLTVLLIQNLPHQSNSKQHQAQNATEQNPTSNTSSVRHDSDTPNTNNPEKHVIFTMYPLYPTDWSNQVHFDGRRKQRPGSRFLPIYSRQANHMQRQGPTGEPHILQLSTPHASACLDQKKHGIWPNPTV
jgi:hypothetical protein